MYLVYLASAMPSTARPKAEDPLAGNPNYTRIKDLGRGTYGSVGLYAYRVGPATSEVAVKSIEVACWAPDGWDLLEREVRNHRKLRHPHVIRFKEVGLCHSASLSVYLALE